MAKWNQTTWNSGALWGPATTPDPSSGNNKQNRKNDMKRQPYFPRIVSEWPGWFRNLREEIPVANVILTMPAVDVTNRSADALYLEHASGIYLTKVREFGTAYTAFLDRACHGTESDPLVFTAFTPPEDAPPAVLPGALDRIFAFVQQIKKSSNYTHDIGLQLGIVGDEDTQEATTPEFSLALERHGLDSCECVKVRFKKHGHAGVVIYSRRGGGDWEMLAIDLASPYLDGRPLLVPGQAETREYRLQFYANDAPTGDLSPLQSIAVAP
jgi:hypothetical protein